MKYIYLLVAAVMTSLAVSAQTTAQEEVLEDLDLKEFAPKVHGTIRGRYEVMTDADEASRFEARDSRLSVEGNLPLHASYMAEVNLSDEGTIKLLTAYGRLNPYKSLNITLGQFRVPFTIDAHRGPHSQYFSNRSFIAKYAGNVRDVGVQLGYAWTAPFRIVLDGAVFNGYGIGETQKGAWHNDFNYSARLQTFPLKNVNLTASVQRTRCNALKWAHYTAMDFGAYYDDGHLHLEGEFLRKYYENDVCDDVNAFNLMAIYKHKLRKCYFHNISYLLRCDYMGDHANGKALPMVTDPVTGERVWSGEERLVANQHERLRFTAGVTFHINYKSFRSDLRLNYEEYRYRDGAKPVAGENDKFVAELMIRF